MIKDLKNIISKLIPGKDNKNDDLLTMINGLDEYLTANITELQVLIDEYAADPETGFKEVKTSEKFINHVLELGLTPQTNLAITGVKVRLKGELISENKLKRPTIALIGELDAIPCPNQMYWPVASTGATHACGHAVQMAVLTMAMQYFVKANIKAKLAGDIVFFAVPAEELIEIDYRTTLVEKGLVKFMSGKQELIAGGEFADIDAALMFHSLPDIADNTVVLQSPAMGFISKTVNYIGKASHAAGAPEKGINALHAANLAWQAIQCLREGFRDEDSIRIHGVVTNGGGAVNVIPDLITYEYVVRAASIEAMQETNDKVNNAVKYAAMALGATAEIIDREGYLPLEQSESINNVVREIATDADINVIWGDDFPGSTDLGDLGTVLPVVQISAGGYKNPLHSQDFHISDFKNAVITPCYLLCATAIKLLQPDIDWQNFMKDGQKYTVAEYQNVWREILKKDK